MEARHGPEAQRTSQPEGATGWHTFLDVMGHELRNPLTPLRMAAHLLNAEGPRPPDCAKLSGIIERQVAAMAQMIDTMLDVSRVARGTLTLNPEPQDLGRILAKVLESWRPLMEAQRQRLRLHLPLAPLPLAGDAARLEQLLGALCANACQFTPADGEIDIAARQDGPTLHLQVKDTGIGMSPETLAGAFTLFFRGEPQSPHGIRGQGIGLTLARHFAELHGGSLTATSDGPGLGSTFSLSLPSLP